MGWLSEIEDLIASVAHAGDEFIHIHHAERMSGVIREFAEVSYWVEKLVENVEGNEPDRPTLAGLRMGKLRILLSNLSPDAKESIDDCIAPSSN